MKKMISKIKIKIKVKKPKIMNKIKILVQK